MKSATKPTSLAAPHLSDSEMVAYLDGELLRSEMARARGHLESCWNCRSRLTIVGCSIDSFLEARKSVLPETNLLAEQRVQQFRERLGRHRNARGSEAVPLWTKLWTQVRGLRAPLVEYRKPVLGVVVLACLLTAMFTDVWNTRVSADTVLLRAEKYEAAGHPGMGTVARSSILISRLDRRTRTTRNIKTLNLVQDSATQSAYVSTEADSRQQGKAYVRDRSQLASLVRQTLGADILDPPLLEYFEAEQWFPDVSAEGFRKLIAGRKDRESSARRQGGSFELHYPFVPGHSSGIAEVLLTVDEKTYSPQQISIITSDRSTEYRFTRTSIVTEARTPQLAMLFAPPVDTQKTSSLALPKLSKPLPLSYANSQASTAEVSIAARLHDVNACLGEEVNVFPMSDGSLLVQGLVDTAERRNAIRRALRAVTAPLKVEVYLPRELKSGSELYSAPEQFAQPQAHVTRSDSLTTVAELPSDRMPLYDQLYRHFSKSSLSQQDTEKQIADFSNQVVTSARQTFLHAWALKKLELEFSAARISPLPASARDEIEHMRRDHRRSISDISHRQSQMLDRVTGSISTPIPPSSVDSMDSDSLLRLAEEQHDLVRALFTTSHPASDPTAGLARLKELLHRIGS